jgi:hypothetical protein
MICASTLVKLLSTKNLKAQIMTTKNIGSVQHRAYKLVVYNYPMTANPSLEIRLTKLITKALIIDIDERWLANMLNQDAAEKIEMRIKQSLH